MFEKVRSNIEEHLYDSVFFLEKDSSRALRSVAEFNLAIDSFLKTLEVMYQTPRKEDDLGERSFPIKNGRYRIFYYVRVKNCSDFEITLLDIDDNLQSNIDRFPNPLITFDNED